MILLGPLRGLQVDLLATQQRTVAPGLMTGPVDNLIQRRVVVADLVKEHLAREQLDEVVGRAVESALTPMADVGTGYQQQGLGCFERGECANSCFGARESRCQVIDLDLFEELTFLGFHGEVNHEYSALTGGGAEDQLSAEGFFHNAARREQAQARTTCTPASGKEW